MKTDLYAGDVGLYAGEVGLQQMQIQTVCYLLNDCYMKKASNVPIAADP